MPSPDSQVRGLDAKVLSVNVQHQTLPLYEALATLLALVRPVSRVYLHMAQKIRAESERRLHCEHTNGWSPL